MSFRGLFADLAARQPRVEAILAPDRSPLTFGDLPSRLDSIRAFLNECGIGRGDLVAVALPKGPELAVCCVALTTCAIAVPLDPDCAGDELDRQLARLRPKAIVLPADGGAVARHRAVVQRIPVIDLAFDPVRPIGAFDLQSDLRGVPERPGWNDGDDIALILLTSGSSGRPKLVPRRQRHLTAYAHGFSQVYRLGAADRCIHVMPMFHGHGATASLLQPLLLGGGVVCPDRFDVASFFAQVERFSPTWYSAGYTIHHSILDQIEPYRAVAREARLRFIRSGSGRLEPRIMRGLEDAFGAPVVERYGMSETSDLTCNPLPPAARKAGTVGIPSINEVRVIGENGALLGPNRDGEVVARGPSVFDGYWDDPQATEEAFVDGWFRTGDLGRFDEDGYLTITGRIKDLINRGGEKLSPVEVEAILCEHPQVGAACVFPVAHPTLGEEVLAAVVPVEGSSVAEQDVLAHARARLAGFKVPRRLFVCTSLPKNGSGKVHRAGVADMCVAMLGQAGAARTARSVRPPTALEREVLQLWNAVLKRETADLDQDFFLAGGDSLRAAELFARIGKRLGIVLGLAQIFDDAATVSGIARLVERARGSGGARRELPPGLVPIKAAGDRSPLFAVPGNGGNPLGFVHLGRLLDRRQPFYGIESRGLDGSTPPLDRMEDIAADNIRCVRALQPTGPYYLSGACFGARVAYEMARQLAVAGQPVGLLLMLDPSPPFTDGVGRPRGQRVGRGHRPPRFPTARFALDRMALHVRSVASLRGVDRRAYLRQKLELIGEIVRQRDLFRGDRSELHQRAVREANSRAGRSYIPGAYAGPTVLCFTRDRPIRGDHDYRLDWLRLLPQCGEPTYVAGDDSSSMINLTNAFALADQVNGWLSAALQSDVEPSTARAPIRSTAR